MNGPPAVPVPVAEPPAAPASAPATGWRARTRTLRFAALVVLVVGALTWMGVTGVWRQLEPALVRDRVAAFGPWGPLVFIAVYSVASFPFLPRAVMALGGGAAFGLASIGYTWVGAVIGESFAFAAARGLGRDFFAATIAKRLPRMETMLAADGFRAVLVLRLIPLVPCDLVNYLAGLGPVRYRDFLLATAIGIVPGCIAYAAIGDGLVSARPGVLVGGVGLLAVLALLPLWARRRPPAPG